jgi:hypothetical protein
MFWMRAYLLGGQVGGGWALEFESFLGPVKLHQADRRVPFGAQKTRDPKNLSPLILSSVSAIPLILNLSLTLFRSYSVKLNIISLILYSAEAQPIPYISVLSMS